MSHIQVDLKQNEVWFVTGSQHLYGDRILKQVEENSKAIAEHMDSSGDIAVRVCHRPTVKSPEEILQVCLEANASKQCVGLVFWMHTFSPAKMWIAGLTNLQKPFLHFHTQFNRDIPWDGIDMDFMNLNQSAHGGREFGFMVSRLRKDRKVVVGHWKDPEALARIDAWTRAASAWADWQGSAYARFGDNMRQVAVTEGDKVNAQVQLGYQVHAYGLGDLVKRIDAVTEAEIDQLCEEYRQTYTFDHSMMSGEPLTSMREAARIEAGLRKFLEEGKFKGYTNTFENLYGMRQLPGIASQRLMAEGYGFGAEGDWKTCALVRALKVMGSGRNGGTSFMEDYTYHLEPGQQKVLGAHMLEVCSSIASKEANISLEVHPLGIGGKEDPVRLVFDAEVGPALNATMLDMGNRFRLLVNTVESVAAKSMPKLPVARALWKPHPSLPVAAGAWILAGGAHHTAYSQAVSVEMLEDFAEIAGIELSIIDEKTELRDFKQTLRWNDLFYHLNRGL